MRLGRAQTSSCKRSRNHEGVDLTYKYFKNRLVQTRRFCSIYKLVVRLI